jgi:DNA-binding HxlR family transcriptional regulator
MAVFDLLGRRWTLRVLWELDQADEPPTFRELRAACGDVSSSLLTRRLAELTETGIVARAATGYTLTELGAELVAILAPLLAWSRKWAAALDE